MADTSGARVHELSAPLAAAGISILYQSSYMSDFIFVSPNLLDAPKRPQSALCYLTRKRHRRVCLIN